MKTPEQKQLLKLRERVHVWQIAQAFGCRPGRIHFLTIGGQKFKESEKVILGVLTHTADWEARDSKGLTVLEWCEQFRAESEVATSG